MGEDKKGPSPFRDEYRNLNPDEVQAISEIKEAAAVLYEKFGTGTAAPIVGAVVAELKADAEIQLDAKPEEQRIVKVDPRMMSLAKTNLEQAVMWAVKAITG